jgi:hypothetical protein
VTATGYANDAVVVEVNNETGDVTLTPEDVGAAPALLLVPEPGRRWFLTDDPFNGTFTAGLQAGDRFTYPVGHASARETYRWSGAAWVFEQIIAAQPAAADAVVQGLGSAWTNLTNLNANAAHWATHNAQVRLIDGGTAAELSGRLTLTGTVNSGTAWAVIPAGYRPLFEMKISARSAGTGATGNTVTIGTDGSVSFGASLNSGAELPLDNIRFRVTE